MSLVKLGDKAVGSVVKLKVDGTMRDFIVVHQGKPSTLYDTSCDGTWLLLKDLLETRTWNSSNSNIYKTSTIHSYLNSTWLSKLDANIQTQVKSVKLPYANGNSAVASGANGLECKIFLLSGYEVGFTQFTNGYFPIDGARLAYFEDGTGMSALNKRIATLNGAATNWWLRSPHTYSAGYAWRVNTSGGYTDSNCASTMGIRPAFTLPATLFVSDDGSVSVNTAPTTPAAISIPSQINGGSTITITWGASTDAEDNLAGCIVERSLDGGSSWTQIYQGGARSTTNLVPFGASSVMYRVKAYDTEGLESGWRTSGQAAVVNNTAPTVPSSITVPEHVQGGQPLAVSWAASYDGEDNLAGYSLERQVDGGDWAAAYSGDQLSFTDMIAKGWQTVAYRVRAYDAHSAYSGFAVSETREVNNNTPPAITCEFPANTSLGVQNEGVSVAYTVEDEEGDAVTVAEAVDGAALRTFTVELGGANRFQLDGMDFMKLLNGRHTLTITAADSASSAVHSLSFTKDVASASVTLERPMEADGPISVCVLSVSGYIPPDTEYKVEVTNNALDEAPAWEDCTAAVRAGQNYIFSSGTAAQGFAFNFRLRAERGPSGAGGYITSVQGGFQ